MAVPITLNIYDLTPFNNCLHYIGLGAYHTGVQIFDTEFCYGASQTDINGVMEVEPLSNKQIRFRKSIPLGECKLSYTEIEDIISEMKVEFIGSEYDIFKRNCNHFSEEFVRRLLGIKLPRYLSRLSDFGKLFRCFLSKKLISGGTTKPKHRKTDSVYLASKRLKEKKFPYKGLVNDKAAAVEIICEENSKSNISKSIVDTDHDLHHEKGESKNGFTNNK